MYINRDEKYKLKIQDINVLNDEYEVDSDSGNRVIQIGSADYTIIGPHLYIDLYDCNSRRLSFRLRYFYLLFCTRK